MPCRGLLTAGAEKAIVRLGLNALPFMGTVAFHWVRQNYSRLSCPLWVRMPPNRRGSLGKALCL